jgi:hypothetical protein
MLLHSPRRSVKNADKKLRDAFVHFGLEKSEQFQAVTYQVM